MDEIRTALSVGGARDIVDIVGISTDTRSVKPGMLFVALRGERFDAHSFVPQAFASGAASAVVEEVIPGFEDKCLVVSNSLTALGQIASAWRQKFSIPVVAVTGSVGKTTMKEMIALVLSPLGPILKSDRNENNEVGLPQTLLRLTGDHRGAVVEMGMRGAGQIDYLTNIAKPTVGVISMIGESHIELVGSRQGIADAKGELIGSLRDTDVAVLNADDEFFEYLSEKTSARTVSFGTSAKASVRILKAERDGAFWRIRLQAFEGDYELKIGSPAWHDVINAAGAFAVALVAGVDSERALEALADYHPFEMRMQMLQSKSGASIINDCYNAAPSSVISALKTLAAYPKSGDKIAILGDMRELGHYATEYHRDVAAAAASNGISRVYPVGDLMPKAFSEADKSFETSEEAAHYVLTELHLSSNDVVLVKGSRALELERVVNALVER